MYMLVSFRSISLSLRNRYPTYCIAVNSLPHVIHPSIQSTHHEILSPHMHAPFSVLFSPLPPSSITLLVLGLAVLFQRHIACSYDSIPIPHDYIYVSFFL